MNRKLNIILFLLLFGFSHSSYFGQLPKKGEGQNSKFEVRNGNSLYFFDSNGRTLVKELKKGQEFQGFSAWNGQKLFLAYSDNESEPSTTMSIYDLRLRTEHVIGSLGATTDSRFDLNKENSLVVFNWYKGIYFFSLKKVALLPENRAKQMNFEKSLNLLRACDYNSCFEPHWLGQNRVSFAIVDDKGKKTIHFADLPKNFLD